MASYVATILGNVIIVRALPPSEFGQLSYVLWLMGLISGLLPLSVPYATSLYVGSLLAGGNYEGARKQYRRGVRIGVGLALVAALALLVSGNWWIPEAFSSGLALVLAVALVMSNPIQSTLQSWGAAQLDYRAITIGKILGALAFLGLACFSWYTHSLPVAFGAHAGRVALMALWWIPVGWRVLRDDSVKSGTVDRVEIKNLRPFWRLALEQSISRLGTTIAWSRFELALLAWLATSVQVAQLRVGLEIAGPVLMATTLFTAPLRLYAARNSAISNTSKTMRSVAGVLRLTGTGSGIVALGISVASPIIVPCVFGSEYQETVALIPLLGLANLLHAQRSIQVAVCQGLEQPLYSVFAMSFGAIVLLGIAVPLIPVWGAFGAATARVATDAVSLIAMWYLASHLLPGVVKGRDLAISAVIFGIPLSLMSMIMIWVDGFAAVGICASVAVGALAVAGRHGLLRREDIKSLDSRLARIPWGLGLRVRKVLVWFSV